MTRDEIIERIACAVTAQGCVMQGLPIHVVDFAPSARGFLVLVEYRCGAVHIKMDLNERDELWAKWHEAARTPALTVSGAAG